MKLTDICIKRPVFSTVLSLVVILLGLVTFFQLQVRQYPRIEEPEISIFTTLEGASPSIVETQITKLLEDALAGLEGLSAMESKSEQGQSRISLRFRINRDIEAAANDVRDKISRVRSRLPQDTSDPRISKSNAEAQAIIYLALSSPFHAVGELADIAYRLLQSQLEVLPGVATIDVWGMGEYEMRITLDPVKLANFRITPEEVANAIKRQNIEKPAGSITTKFSDLVITTRASLVTPKDFEHAVVENREGSLIRVSDLGTVELQSIDNKQFVRFNDKPAIGIGITKQSTANPLTIAQELKKILPRLQEQLPKGMQLQIANDETIFIEKSIQQVYKTLFEATALVILVILVFLRSFRAIIIPIVTIPVSLVGAFFLIYVLGFSINLLTLLALVLAIGLVVDDAIVMLENIYRHIEEGMKPLQAAFKGAKEISFAVVAMTITLAAVYAPIALSPGLTGKLFTEFALTLAGAVILSGFVALTLSPMMCGRLLKAHDKKLAKKDLLPKKSEHPFQEFYKRFDARAEVMLDKIDELYAKFLRLSLETPVTLYKHFKVQSSILVLAAGFLVAVAGVGIGILLPKEFTPSEDMGIMKIRASSPFGASAEFVNKYFKRIEEAVRAVPEVQSRLSIVAVPGESYSLNFLVPWEQRKRNTADIAKDLSDQLMNMPGLSAYAFSKSTRFSTGASDSSFALVLKTTLDVQQMKKKAKLVSKLLNTMPELREIYSEVNEGQEYVVTIDRDKAAALGVDLDTIASTLDIVVGGKPFTKFKRENKLQQVRIQLTEESRSTPSDITNVFVKAHKNRKEVLVPLSEVVTIKKQPSPINIGHVDGFRATVFTSDLNPGYSLEKTLDKAKKLVSEEVGDSQTFVDFSGESKRFLEESKNIYIIFGLALAFIYLVLAAQYESWRDPWIIMLSVPMSLTGGILLLGVFGQSINLYSWIGLVTLIGLITKHGILIVDFANKLKADGLSRLEAVIEASRLRLRPILMTTFAMVLGALPLAIGSGAGIETRRPIGLVIVGGMLLGTIFTLFVVPAVYTFLSAKKAAADLDGLEKA